ncbi:MAG: tetratricopeptide repeat protein [Bacteroidota bacterium]
MARRRNQKKETIVDVVEARDKAQNFFEENQNLVLGILTGIVLLIGGYFAYNTLVMAPKENEAASEMRQAQVQFERDSFALALTNPGGGNLGFLDIASIYGGTSAGNSANYYAGISYLNLGDFEGAVAHLEDFSAPDEVFSIMKYGALGDAYSELGQNDKALKSYKSAVNAGSNEALTVIYLKRLALFLEKEGNTGEARKYFQQIKDDYPNTPTGKEVDKYLARLK